MIHNYSPSAFELVLGFVGFVSWTTFVFCYVTLRSYIDVDTVTKEELAQLVKGGIPKKSQMTAEGAFRYNLAIATFLVGIVICGGIVIHKTLVSG
jgi:hypothetical protein